MLGMPLRDEYSQGVTACAGPLMPLWRLLRFSSHSAGWDGLDDSLRHGRNPGHSCGHTLSARGAVEEEGRPVVEPELFASLRPPSYSGGLTEEPGEETLAE